MTVRKRDLSNKSTNEKERKKKPESSLDLLLSKETSDGTDVFTEGIEFPHCGSILYDCFKNQKLMSFTNFLPPPKMPRLKVLSSCKMSVNPLSS